MNRYIKFDVDLYFVWVRLCFHVICVVLRVFAASGVRVMSQLAKFGEVLRSATFGGYFSCYMRLATKWG